MPETTTTTLTSLADRQQTAAHRLAARLAGADGAHLPQEVRVELRLLACTILGWSETLRTAAGATTPRACQQHRSSPVQRALDALMPEVIDLLHRRFLRQRRPLATPERHPC